MDPEVTPQGLVEANASCPCCKKIFTGYGSDQREATEDAIEQLEIHMESNEC